MSVGPFIDAKYQNNGGNVQAIRIQPETLTLNIGGVDNAEPAAEINSPRGVSASGKRSILFTGARRVGIRITGGTAPFAVGTVHYIPVLTPAAFQDMVEPRSQTGTYQGQACVCIGGSPERP